MNIPNWERFLVAGALVSFLLIGCLWIRYPGLQYDEALFAVAAYPGMPGSSIYSIDLFDRPVSVMVLPYLGALKGWIYRPIMEAMPRSAATARVPALLLGALTIFLLYRIARPRMGAGAALAAVWFTASDPTFLFTTRMDWGPVVLQRLCLALGCLLLLLLHERRQARYTFAAFFVFGLGLFDKITFHWLLLGLGVAGLVVFPRELRQGWRVRWLALAAAGFLLGASPYISYQFSGHASALALSLERRPSEYVRKYAMLRDSLNGTVLQGWLTPLTSETVAEPPDALAHALYGLSDFRGTRKSWFLIALLASLLLLPLSLRTRFRRVLLFVLLFCLAALAQMALLVDAGSAHHFVLIYPFPHLFVAATLAALTEKLALRAGQAAAATAAAATAAAIVVGGVASTAHQYGQILKFGGNHHWTDAIYPLSSYLNGSPHQRTVAVDWGMAMQLHFLSKGRLAPTSLPSVTGDSSDTVREIEFRLGQGDLRFVSYAAEDLRVFPKTFEVLREVLARRGYQLRVLETFADRNGRLMFQVHGLEEVQPAKEPP